MQTEAKKAGFVCLAALILSAAFSLASYILARLTGVFAAYALSWQILAGAVVWAVLAIQFYQKSLARQEKLDMELLGQSSGDTIFEAQKTHSELFAVAQNRLRLFEKWFLPIFSFILAAYQIAIGAILIRALLKRQEMPEQSHLLSGAVVTVAIAFLSFLFSLYTTGLSRQKQWRPLRAGASLLLVTAILSFAIAVGMAFAQFKVGQVLTILDWVVPIMILIPGIESALNFIFDIYRPRLEGQYSITAFDSRLFAMLASPGNILQTAAGAIDYQFGFKVSQTWFYKIIEQAIIPLVLVSAIILYLLSCIVIIGPESQAIIERFGSATDSQGKVRFVEPGLSFKLPWPFDVARVFPTRAIQELHIGYVPEEDPQKQRTPLLWGKEHYKAEYNLLVATDNINSQEKGVVPVSIIRAAVPVQYRVVDLYKYLYGHSDSQKVLEELCYRELVKFAAGSRIESDSDIAGQASLLGAGRAQASAKMVGTIQQEADKIGLGVEIVFMGIEGFHPPPEVAPDFQANIGAIQQKQAAILAAIAYRDANFTENVGSVKQALALYELADKYSEVQQAGNKKETEKAKAQLDDAFSQASGELYAKLRLAKSYAYEKAIIAEATGNRFVQQLAAYKASKQIYKHELRMAMLEEALANVRKYIIVAEGDKQVTIIDLQEKLMPDLYDIKLQGK